jgi:hypothetical protein
VIDFDSRVSAQASPATRRADHGHRPTRPAVDVAAQRDLHRAEGTRKVRAVTEQDIRRQALVVFSDGEDTSSLVSFDEVLDLAKRSETSIYAIALRGPDVQTKGFREAEFVMKTLALGNGGRSFFPAKIEDLNGVYSQIADELASQYTHRVHVQESAAGRRLASHRCPRDSSERDARTKRGYYAPTAVEPPPARPLRGGGVAYAIHFARRDVTVGRTATTLLLLACCPHLRHRDADDGSAACAVRQSSRAVSTFVWLLTLSYLYLELTTDERAMGVFILPIVIGAAAHSGALPGSRNATRCSTARGSGSTSRRCSSPTPASAGRRAGLTYVLQFKEIKKKHLGISTPACRRCRSSTA